MNDAQRLPSYTLVISCPDKVGIVDAVSQFVADRGGSLIESNHHTDVNQGWFYMRNVISASSLQPGLDQFREEFAALAAAPGDARTQFVLAVVLMELGRDAQALPLFTQLAQQFPELPDPLNNIALLEVRAGRLDAALKSLEMALRNDPGHRAARANLAEVHLMLAAAAWERLAQDAPLEPRLARRLEAVRALIGPAAPPQAAPAAPPATPAR